MIQYALLICYLYSINTTICKGNSWITGGNNHLNNFLFQLDNAKRGIPSQGGKVDLDLWPRDPKSIGFLLSSWWMCMWSLKVIGQKLKSLLCPQGLIQRVPKLTLTFDPITQNQLGSSCHHGECACEVWKWLGKNWSRYCVHKVLYKECQSWPWPLTPWPKINRVPPLTINNLHVKFESDCAKTVVCIVSTRSYTQSAKVGLDLWPRDPKSIGFLLSSLWMCMWSLKVIGQKL